MSLAKKLLFYHKAVLLNVIGQKSLDDFVFFK